MMRKLKQGLLLLLCIGLSVLMMRLPAAWAERCDEQLLREMQVRPPIEGMLSEQAQDIPILYALYRRRYLASHFAEESIEWDNEEEGSIFQELLQIASDSELLPDWFKQTVLLDMLSEKTGMECSVYFRGGFAQCICEKRKPGNEENEQFQENHEGLQRYLDFQCHMDGTGLITSFHYQGPMRPVNAKAMLNKYRTYLGLDGLDDWQTIQLDASGNIGYWSAMGQIYLYCVAEENTLAFEALSLSCAEFERMKI